MLKIIHGSIQLYNIPINFESCLMNMDWLSFAFFSFFYLGRLDNLSCSIRSHSNVVNEDFPILEFEAEFSFVHLLELSHIVIQAFRALHHDLSISAFISHV